MQLQYPITSDLLTVLAIWSRELRIRLQASGVTNAQFLVLDCLHKNNNNLHASCLSSQLGITPSLLSFLLVTLEQKSLILRNEDQGDRRKVIIELTIKGQDQLKTAWKTIHKVTSHLMEPIGEKLRQNFLKQAGDYMQKSFGTQTNEMIYEGLEITNSVLAGERHVKRLLDDYQMTFKEFRVLFELYNHRAGLNAKGLAQQLLLNMPDVTAVNKELENKQLIIRTRDSYDHRSVNLDISNIGYKAIIEIAPLVDQVIFENSGNAPIEERENILKAFSLITQDRRKYLL